MEWSEVLADPSLHDLPYKIETNSYGQIVMSPASRYHSRYEAEIAILLRALRADGVVHTEAPVQTDAGVKVPDVAWASDAFEANPAHGETFASAPELCIEVVSRGNSKSELDEKRRLYFAAGAFEVWECNLRGQVTFHDPNGPIAESALFPGFPQQIG
jgi:Uma2 family endonuclease